MCLCSLDPPEFSSHLIYSLCLDFRFLRMECLSGPIWPQDLSKHLWGVCVCVCVCVTWYQAVGSSLSLSRGWHIYYWLKWNRQKPELSQWRKGLCAPCHLLSLHWSAHTQNSSEFSSGILHGGIQCPLANPLASSWPFQQLLPLCHENTASRSLN